MRSVKDFSIVVCRHTVIIFAIAIIQFSCKSDTVGPQGTYLTGIVKDSLGNPVPYAYLNFNFRYQVTGFPGVVVDTPSALGQGIAVSLGFTLSQPEKVRVVVRNFIQQYIATVYDDTSFAGTSEIDVNLNGWKDSAGKDLYSDVYRIVATVHDTVITPEVEVPISRAQHLSTNPRPFLRTDDQGKFAISMSRLPFGETTASGLRIDNTQYLTAFNSQRFGRTLVSANNASFITIVLDRTK
jgi:hypothetical protein